MGEERKIAMEYRIISGAAEERRQVYMAPGSAARSKRGPRKSHTPPAQVKRNEIEARLRLARILNSNYVPGDLWINLMYPAGKEPAYEQAEADADRMIRALRGKYREKHGKALKWVLVTSVTDPRTGAPAPVHHHLVLQAMPWEDVASLWEPGPAYLDCRLLDGSGDYTGIAWYIVGNAAAQPGKPRWRVSRGMDKPVYTQPRPCGSIGSFGRLPADIRVKERRISDGENAAIKAAYIRFVRPGETLRRAKAAAGGRTDADNVVGRGRGSEKNARGRGEGLNTADKARRGGGR